MRHRDANHIAQFVSDRYELDGVRVRPLKEGDCNLFEIVHGPERFCLKIMSESTPGEVQSQMEFMDHLRSSGIQVVRTISPVESTRPIGSAESEAVLFAWIDGEPVGSRPDNDMVVTCGALLSTLHASSRDFTPSKEFHRRRWETVYAHGEGGWLEELFGRGGLNYDQRRVIEKAARRTHRAFSEIGPDPVYYGMLHADFHGHNLIKSGARVWIIDFDDCGWGHWLFDIVWPAILFAKANGEASPFLDPFLRGYERIRPLSANERALLPDAMIAAGLAAIEMVFKAIHSPTAPIVQQWNAFAVNLIDGLCNER